MQMLQWVGIDGRVRSPRGVNLCLPSEMAFAAKDATKTRGPCFSRLNRHRLSHDRAAASDDLKVGNRSPAWRNGTGGSGEGPERFHGGFVEEWAHGSGLPQ